MGTSKYKDSAEGAVYHLYNRGNRKQTIFEEAADYRLYLALLAKYGRETSFSVVAYCLMPNHVHLLVRQNSELGPTKLISRLHTSYAMYFNKKYKKVGHLFQGRYKQKIVSNNEYLERIVSYIHINPVKDNIVSSSEKYLWSSDKWHQLSARNQQRGLCDVSAVRELGVKRISGNIATKLASQLSPYDVFETS